MKSLLVAFVACLVCPSALCMADAVPSARPNIIFIMADDPGYTDVACFGSGYYETPNIDRLATQGMKLLNHHHCQNCTPTRAALMSGQYGACTGVYTVGGTDRFDWSTRPLRPVDNVTELPLDRDIIAKQLKAAGYATGMFGKWHIGQKGDYLPGQRGFDEAIVSMGQHFDFATNPETDYPDGQYLADFLTDKAGDITDNAPLRSGKGSLYEGGTREPFIVRWPGVTHPGSTCNEPTIHVDLFPTMLELAAAPAPRQVLDGESLVTVLQFVSNASRSAGDGCRGRRSG